MTLKINLSRPKRDEEGNLLPRHLVLTCSKRESYEIGSLLYMHVLSPNGAGPATAKRSLSRDIARYSLALRHLDRLKLTFPYADISPGLDKRLLKEQRRSYEATPIPRVKVPGFHGRLMGHQKIAIDMITRQLSGQELVDGHEVDCFFLDDEMGLGKTLMLLSVIQVLDTRPCLVIVPNNTKYPSWMADMQKFFRGRLDMVVIDSDKQSPADRSRIVEEQHDITVINHEAIWRIPEVANTHWGMVTVDEYHRFKNPEAKQSEAFLNLKFDKAVFMSGTPLLNGRPEELWTTMHKAWPDKYPSFPVFKANHVVVSRHTGKVVAYRNLDQIQAQIDPVELRRRKDMVLRDLPDKIYSRHTVQMSPEQRRIYDRILDEMMLEIVDDNGHTIQRPIVSVLAQITRLKQACFSPELFEGSTKSAKIDDVKSIVAELDSNSEKAIVFSQWSRATKILKRELAQYNPAYVDGNVPIKNRTEEIHRFQTDDDCKVFIGTIASCREGITLTSGSYVIFTDKGWTPAENEQAAARAHRIGQKKTVNVIEIFAADTIEADIEDMLQAKQNTFNALIENDGGVRHKRMNISSIRQLLEAHR